MRNLAKKILESILRLLAEAILDKYHPQVVAITGSVGKTSTKDAIYTVLAPKFKVRKNLKNYNNEIGIPVSIIGAESGGKSLIKWLGVFLKALALIIFKGKNYPEILVLEMGADHPGDIKYLMSFVPVKIGVVTAVAPVHLEFFKTLENIEEEKSQLISNLAKGGFAVLNNDDPRVLQMAQKTSAKVITFGFSANSQIRASGAEISRQFDSNNILKIQGVSFKLNYRDKIAPVLLPNVLGEHIIYTALAAIAVGIIYNLNLEEIIKNLKNFELPKGRMNLIKGIKNTLIIDDTYNSSPFAVTKALYQLGQIKFKSPVKKIAVLGDMLELGSYTEQGHQEVGEAVVRYGIDYLVTVGEMSRDIVRGALKKRMGKDHCFNFKNSVEAGKFLQQRISPGDLILVKGSQGMRMERTVKEIMAEPQRAQELLVRQEKPWI